jgi:hypothetical protein
MNIRFVSIAEDELVDAFSWHEMQAPGIGYEFLAEFDRALDRIGQYPESASANRDGMRRVLINRFPYGIWYALEEDIVVYAIAHLHREPHYWLDRTE